MLSVCCWLGWFLLGGSIGIDVVSLSSVIRVFVHSSVLTIFLRKSLMEVIFKKKQQKPCIPLWPDVFEFSKYLSVNHCDALCIRAWGFFFTIHCNAFFMLFIITFFFLLCFFCSFSLLQKCLISRVCFFVVAVGSVGGSVAVVVAAAAAFVAL